MRIVVVVTTAITLSFAAIGNATGVVTIDNEEGTPNTPGGPNYLEWTMVSNSPTPTIDPYNTSAPIRGAHDIRVTGDTGVNGDTFQFRKQYVGGIPCGTFGTGQTYMGVRVKQQSFAWDLQLGFNCSQESAAFRSQAVTVPAGSGYFDAVLQVTNSGLPTWGVSAGSPTNGAEHYVQFYGIIGAELTATLPSGTGAFDMQFDEVSFTDPANQSLPVAISSFSAE
jgi:hypothetical protein